MQTLYSLAQSYEYLREGDLSGQTLMNTSPQWLLLKEAIELGQGHKPLTSKIMKQWLEKLAPDTSAEEEKFALLISKINKLVPEAAQETTDVKIIETAANLLCIFQSAGELNGNISDRIEKLILSYFLCYYNRPLIVIRQSEIAPFHEAHSNINKMKLFIADKIREKTFHRGSLYNRTSTPKENVATEFYQNEDGEKLAIEWNDVFKAKNLWKNNK